MIVDGDAESLARRDQMARDIDVRPAWRRIAARMVVDDDHSGGAQFEGPCDRVADVNRARVDRAGGRELILDQPIAAVEIENPDVLDGSMGQLGMEMIEQRLPVGKQRLHIKVASQRVEHRPAERPYFLDSGEIAAHGTALAARRPGENRWQRPELGDQPSRREGGVA